MVAGLFGLKPMDQADALREMHDWLDAAAVFDRAVRVFADIVRPVVVGTKAARLSPSNIILLAGLERTGRGRVADVMRIYRMQPSNVSYSLKALAEAGCVTLEKDPDNRRAQIVVITPAGVEIARAVRARCAADQLRESLRKIKSCLDATDIFEEGIELASVLAEPVRRRDEPVKLPEAATVPETQISAAVASSIRSNARAPSEPAAAPSAGTGVAAKPILPPRRPPVRLPLARTAPR